MAVENLAEDRTPLPFKELEILREKLEKLDSLTNEVVDIEQALEGIMESRSRRVPMEKPSIMSRPLAEVGLDFVSADAVFQYKTTTSEFKKRREVAFRQMVGFLKDFSFSHLLHWASKKSQAIEFAAAEVAAFENIPEYSPSPAIQEQDEEAAVGLTQGDLKKSLREFIRELAKYRILDREPALGAEEVARCLGSSSNTNLRQLALDHRKRGDLLGVKVNGKYLYPAFQFDETRQEVYPIVKEINKILSSESDSWAVFGWWVSPNARLADNMAPKVLLSDPDKHSILRSMAEAVVEDAG